MLRVRASTLVAASLLSAISVAVTCGGDSEQSSSATQGSSSATASGGSSGAAQGGDTATGSAVGGAIGMTASGRGGQGGSPGTGGQGGAAAGGAPGAGGNGGNGGSGTGDINDPCTWGNGECNQMLFCSAPGCGGGTCQPILTTAAQTQEFDPQCGCDGINYFNPTVAETHGAAVSHVGPCTNAEEVACVKNVTPCGPGLSCNIEVANSAACSPTLSAGVCWAAPISCSMGQPRARGCLPPNAACANKCALIRSQNGWFEDLTCQ